MMKKTKNDGFEKSVDDLANLEKVVASRPGTIRFGPLLDGWPTPSHPYAFLSPDDRGVRACQRVTHPGAQPLLGGVYDELCDLVLGGTNLIFELDPRRPAAVHFCETLLATLANSERCRAASHEPFAERLVRHTDWSIPDGIGPTTLPAPCVIGYTAASNIREAEVMQPAVLWSRRWLLSPDPVARLAKIMAKAIRLTGHCRSGKDGGPVGAPADWEAPLWRRISDMVLNSDKLTFGQIAGQIRQAVKSHAEEIRQTAMTDQSQVDATVNCLRSRVKAAELEWTRCLRHPSMVMFDQAMPSFAEDEVLATDCWGHPILLSLVFGEGVVWIGYPSSIRSQHLAAGKHTGGGPNQGSTEALEAYNQRLEQLEMSAESTAQLRRELARAQKEPQVYALEMVERICEFLTNEEMLLWRAFHRYDLQKDVAKALKKRIPAASPSSISRWKKKINEKLERAGLPAIRQGVLPERHPKPYKSRDGSGTSVEDLPSRQAPNWTLDKAERQRTIQDYLRADESLKKTYRDNYPDIDAEADQYKKELQA